MASYEPLDLGAATRRERGAIMCVVAPRSAGPSLAGDVATCPDTFTPLPDAAAGATCANGLCAHGATMVARWVDTTAVTWSPL